MAQYSYIIAFLTFIGDFKKFLCTGRFFQCLATPCAAVTLFKWLPGKKKRGWALLVLGPHHALVSGKGTGDLANRRSRIRILYLFWNTWRWTLLSKTWKLLEKTVPIGASEDWNTYQGKISINCSDGRQKYYFSLLLGEDILVWERLATNSEKVVWIQQYTGKYLLFPVYPAAQFSTNSD